MVRTKQTPIDTDKDDEASSCQIKTRSPGLPGCNKQLGVVYVLLDCHVVYKMGVYSES